jgi:tRNA G18 (ribose-2'-O)-methylase SpoU
MTKNNSEVILILDNVRSAFNVGNIFRTSEALGVKKIICVGITPHYREKLDPRLPHIITKTELKLNKTALGAEQFIEYAYFPRIEDEIIKYKQKGYTVLSLEQTKNSISLNSYRPESKIVLIVGNEVNGISQPVLALSDLILEINQTGQKESLNVTNATAIALFYLLG